MKPVVSVIVPTYNRAELLGSTIESLLASQVPDLEVVIVDDGSTDDTESVVAAYGGPVKYVRQNNAGPAAARNRGFAASQGCYVAYLDDDDRWHPGAVARLCETLDRHPHLPCVFGDTSMGNPEDGYVSFAETYGGAAFAALPASPLGTHLKLFDRWPFFRALAKRNVMFLGSLLLRRRTVEYLRGFDESLRGAADWEFFLRLAASYDLAFEDDGPVAVYVRHEAGMSLDFAHMEEEFARALLNVLAKSNLPSDQLQFVLHRLRGQLFGLAYRAYDHGDFAAARARFASMVRHGHFGFRELMYWSICAQPSALIRMARSVRHALTGSEDALPDSHPRPWSLGKGGKS